jgi:hypothetical protein
MHVGSLVRSGKLQLRLAGLLGVLVLVLSGCYSNNTIGTATFGDVLWTMIAFFFWFMLIWMFIMVFADIFRRNDLSGGWKVIWILVIFLVPLLGILVYLIMRPKMTEQDKQIMAEMEQQQRRSGGYSSADEIAKLNQLKASGAITDAEYADLKAKAM